MRRDAKRGSRGAWVAEAVLHTVGAGGVQNGTGKKKMSTHLRCHRHLAEDESALAETSVSAAGFSSPRLPVRRSCMGLLRTENDHLIFFSILSPAIPENRVSLGREKKERKTKKKKKRVDAL